MYVLYLLLYYSFDKNLQERNEDLAQKLANDKIQSLMNGSGINNIPQLNIITANPNIAKANACQKGPLYIGTNGTDQDCIRTCTNSSASVINVDEGETYIYESTILQSGAHCIIGPRPQCNMKTSYAMMTVNSVVCRSKFPDIVNGPVGNTIVACNNRQINDPQNYLWDYKYNKKFDPLTSDDILDSNELLSDGSYRFRCKFNGYDVRQNKYIEHPYNRFHPFRNYCASQIYAAHPDVKTVINTETGTFECDCGNFDETRVKHMDPNDKTSLCSNVSKEIKTDVRNRQIMTVPYKCFTLFSPIEDVGKYLPCPDDQFTRDGSQTSFVTVPFSVKTSALIEHPMYKDFHQRDSGVHVGKDAKRPQIPFPAPILNLIPEATTLSPPILNLIPL